MNGLQENSTYQQYTKTHGTLSRGYQDTGTAVSQSQHANNERYSHADAHANDTQHAEEHTHVRMGMQGTHRVREEGWNVNVVRGKARGTTVGWNTGDQISRSFEAGRLGIRTEHVSTLVTKLAPVERLFHPPSHVVTFSTSLSPTHCP